MRSYELEGERYCNLGCAAVPKLKAKWKDGKTYPMGLATRTTSTILIVPTSPTIHGLNGESIDESHEGSEESIELELHVEGCFE